MINIIGHLSKDGRVQSLEDHLINVGKILSKNCSVIGLSNIGLLIGLFHDIGKANPNFQEYIRGKIKKSKKSEHSNKSSIAFFKYCSGKSELTCLSQMIGYIIAFHHTGLRNIYENNSRAICSLNMELQRNLKEKIPDEIFLYYEYFKKKFSHLLPNDSAIEEENNFFIQKIFNCSESPNKNHLLRNSLFYSGMTLRLLLGYLFDADWSDTSNFFEEITNEDSTSNQRILFEELLCDSTLYKNFTDKLPKDEMSEIRKDICNRTLEKLDQLLNSNVSIDKIISLNLPTGTGKTIISFLMGIELAKKFKKNKIIYVIPYNSIIEQTADVIRGFLGDKYRILVLEHHSSVENSTEKDYANYRILSESWNSNIIITSAVQYLQIFYSVGKQYNRRLSKLANTVVIFDEIQSIPIKCTQLFIRSLTYLSDFMNSHVILTSATVPDYSMINNCNFIPLKNDKILNLFDDSYLSNLKESIAYRCKIINYLGCTSKEHKPWDDDSLAINILNEQSKFGSVMVICNTISQVVSLYRNLHNINSDIHIFMLSTRFIPFERREILRLIKNYLKSKTPFILVTTPLVEAGVDLDFPVVFRYTSSWYSVIQAAGRCNRNNHLEYGNLYLVDHINNDPTHLTNFLEEINRQRIITENLVIDSGIMFGDEILCTKEINERFSKEVMKKGENYIYLLPKDKTSVEDLLTGDNNFSTTTFFTQSFENASRNFRPIEDCCDVSAVVNFNPKVEELLSIFRNLNSTDYKNIKFLLKKLRPYTIELSRYSLKKLKTINEKEFEYLDTLDTYVFSNDIYTKYKEL